MAKHAFAVACALALFLDASAQAEPRSKSTSEESRAASSIEHGRYLVRIMGCNDCHTKGFAESGGKVRESEWLKGNSMGFRGPWGTTYAVNLRLYFAGLTEDEWIRTGQKLEARPPMPWFSVRALTERDLRDMYRYVRSLAPHGEPAPKFLPPGEEPKGAVIQYPPPPKS